MLAHVMLNIRINHCDCVIYTQATSLPTVDKHGRVAHHHGDSITKWNIACFLIVQTWSIDDYLFIYIISESIVAIQIDKRNVYITR